MRNTLREIKLPQLNGGLNTRDPENGIEDNQSPDMLNLWYKDMALCKRPGQMLLARLSGVQRVSEPYNGGCAVIANGRLYRWDNAGAVRYLSEYREGYAFEEEDYFVVPKAITVDGTVFAAGDCAIYRRSAFVGQAVETTVRTKPGGIAAGDKAAVTVTAAGLGSPVTFQVELDAGNETEDEKIDKASLAAANIRDALNGHPALSALIAADSHGAVVRLVKKYPQGWDDSLAIAIGNGGANPDTGLLASPTSMDAPFWYNALTDVEARYRAGTFNPAAGYPATAAASAYYTASANGTAGGVPYKAGDRAVFDRNKASLTLTGTAGSTSATVTVRAAGVAGFPLPITVTVANGDSASTAAGKVRAAMAANPTLNAKCAVSGTGAVITLTQKEAGASALDATFGCTVACTGLTQGSSVNQPQWRRVGQLGKEPGVFCEFGDTLYYIGGGEVWQIASDYSYWPVTPYVPEVLINARPDLSESDDGEAYNLIGSGFTVKYNGYGGGDTHYFVAEVPEANKFTITNTPGNAIIKFAAAASGFQVRLRGFGWMDGTASAATDGKITLTGHTLMPGDAVQFKAGTGSPPAEISAYDADKATVYQLPQKGLDLTPVSVTVGITVEPYTATLTEGVEFTVNRTTGKVDFAAGIRPHGTPMSGTNNVWITAYKTFTGAKEKITGCKAAVRFGGEAAGLAGGTRVFVTGNAAYPYHYWRSDIGLHVSAGMAYFPDLYEEVLDQNSEPITAAAKMGEQLILFKESSVFAVGYSFDGENVYYPVRECNNAIGCDIPGSVQLIDNRLVFAHSRSGVHMLVSASNALENIVKPLSANVNSLLLRERNLKSACSCDFGRYYWLCVNGHTYLWDYDTTPYYNYSDYDKAQRRLAWYRFDNMGATVFASLGDNLCYGGANGIVILTKSHNDFGKTLPAYFKSKAFDLGSPDEMKTFVALYPGFSTDGNIKVNVSVGNERADNYMTKPFEVRSFDWGEFNWGAFTWNCISFEQVFKMRLNMRKSAYLQVMVSGDELDHGVGLSSLRMMYFANGKVKG